MKLYSVIVCLGLSLFLFGCEDDSRLKKVDIVFSTYDQNEMDVWMTQVIHDRKVVEENLAWFRAVAINLAVHLKLHTYTLPCGCEQPLLPEDMTLNEPLTYASR